jgi:hypothetical protein
MQFFQVPKVAWSMMIQLRNSEDIQSREITNKWFRIDKKTFQLQTKFDFNVDAASKKNPVLNYKCIKRL